MKILIIDGHPFEHSFCRALADSYYDGATQAGHEATLFRLREKSFDPILRTGYKQQQELEPDLQLAQALIKDCQHLMIVCPIWWGGPPALLKGFMDRTFLPGFAFKYRSKSMLWDKFLKGRTARIVVTSDAPSWWMRFVIGDSTVRVIRDATLKFVGISPVKVTRIGKVKWLSQTERERLIEKTNRLGLRGR
ncbi:MAG: NAD(P)H-dependent oxidoreductase [Pirellulales bacterium]